MREYGKYPAIRRSEIYQRTMFALWMRCLTLFGLSAVVSTLSPAFAQASNTPDILAEISHATAQVARQTTPAVVGIWVNLRAGAGETSMEQSRDDRLGKLPSRGLVALSQQDSSPDSNQSPGSGPPQFPQLQGSQQALGSGFIVSPDGYILTNNHVVGDADLVMVIVGDEDPVRAEVVGTDPSTDLAVIRIQGRNNLPVLPFGDSDKLEVGDWVIAIGQPFGLSHTITSGIVSALDRSNMDLATYEDFIQTDAAINPGNSGGPLVNLAGEAVGVNTAILGPEGNIGIGFAIPINMAKDVYDQIRKNGKVIRGFVGVDIQDLTPDLLAAFGLAEDTKGVLISHVADDSPAAAAGLQSGDIIVQFNGKPVLSPGPFQTQVSRLQPGSKVPLTVLRKGAKQSLTIELGTRAAAVAAKPKTQPTLEIAGMAVQDLTDDLKVELDYQGQTGVVVVAVARDSIAGFSGLRPGMLIRQVNHQPIENLQQFQNVLRGASQDASILFLIDNRGAYRYIVLAAPQA
jgi:serine protease Do